MKIIKNYDFQQNKMRSKFQRTKRKSNDAFNVQPQLISKEKAIFGMQSFLIHQIEQQLNKLNKDGQNI